MDAARKVREAQAKAAAAQAKVAEEQDHAGEVVGWTLAYFCGLFDFAACLLAVRNATAAVKV